MPEIACLGAGVLACWLVAVTAGRCLRSQGLLVLQGSVDNRSEVVDEVGIRIESAARPANRVALAVQNDDGRKLTALPAETLEGRLTWIAQYDNRLGCAARVAGRANVHPVDPDVLSLDPFSKRFERLKPVAALWVLRTAEHQHDHPSAQARKSDGLSIGAREAEILRTSRNYG